MDPIFNQHLRRVRTAVLQKHTAASIAQWVTENTTYAMRPYSYKDHEYQQRILEETAIEVNTQKCSQVGVSEVSIRKALGLVSVLSPYTIAYTLPTATFARVFAKTRVDPVIEGSRVLREAVHPTNNSNEVKQFGDSFLYLKGAASDNAPLSTPVDELLHDEYNFSDQEVLGQYISRLTHSKWKRISRFSTPTLPNFGISKQFRESQRWFNMCKCEHCGHWFMPDYYKHVKIPDFRGDLEKVTKQTLTHIRWREAFVECPSCGKAPSLAPEHRQWVNENAEERFTAVGIQVTPFDAPNIVTPSYLIEASTKYDRVQDFVNFSLGLPAEDKEATLTAEEIASLFERGLEAGSGYATVMGVDVGNVYHFVIGAVDGWGKLRVIHTEQVPMGRARARYADLRRTYRVGCTVIDSAPHAETVMALQEDDPNCYASVYTRMRAITTHTVVSRDQDEGRGQTFQRQVNVNRSRAFDAYMTFLRDGNLKIRENDDKNLIIQHHCSMKRVKIYESESGELQYTWQKTDGIDHFHHAFVYCWVAARIRGVSQPLVTMPIGSMRKFRLKVDV